VTTLQLGIREPACSRGYSPPAPPPPRQLWPAPSPAPEPRPDGRHLRAVLLRDRSALRALALATPGAEELRPDRLHAAAFLGHSAARRALHVVTRPPQDIERWAKALEFWGGPAAVVAATLGLLAVWAPPIRVLPPHFAEAWSEFAGEEDPRRLSRRLNHFWGSEATRAAGWPGGALHGLRVALRVAQREGATPSRARATIRFAAFLWASEPASAT
jgi:hypothetical protein